MEYFQIFLVRSLGVLLPQLVVGQPEPTRREQVAPVPVIGKGPGLADQPVDHVPVLDAMLPPPPQPGQLLHPLLGVPHFQPLGMQPHLHPLAHQPARHRVDVPRHPQHTAALHPHPQPLARLQPTGRQRPEHGHLLGQAAPPAGIALGEHLPQKGHVRVPAGEVPLAPQQQLLLQPPLQLVVALLDIAVLVCLPGVDRLPPQPIVPQQRLIPLLEDLRLRLAGLHRRRQPVGPMDRRHPAQLPQGVLQPLAEALQALRETHRPCLPVRVGQHEVVNQVGKGRAGDGHPQLRTVCEVRGTQLSRLVDLGKEHLLGRAVLGSPPLDVPLQGPQLSLAEAAGVLPLEGLEQGLGLQARGYAQLLHDPAPNVGEGVRACPPGVVHTHLTGQPLEPPVFAGGLARHAGFARRLLPGQSLEIEAAEATHLVIGNHAGTLLVARVPDRLRRPAEREI